MTDHLPECWATHESDPPAFCICDELRAFEVRVIAAAVQRVEALGWAFIHSTGELITRAEAVAAIKGDQP
jgi:hypothetical protein